MRRDVSQLPGCGCGKFGNGSCDPIVAPMLADHASSYQPDVAVSLELLLPLPIPT